MAIALAAGCGGDEWTKPATPEPKPVATAGTAAVGATTAGTAAAAPGPKATKAQVGVGQKGREDGDSLAAPITVPIAALFSVKERIAFEILIPKAMQINLATTGHNPKTQKEFMQEIIAANSIQLPALPAGHRYVYDPVKAQLLVVKGAP